MLAVVEGFAAVHDTTIVPEYEIASFPTVGIDETVLHGVGPYFVEQGFALFHRQPQDIGIGTTAEEERGTPRRWMSAQ